jgi:hypothetical protein
VSGVMQQGLLAAAKALGASAVLDKHSLADALLPTIRTLLDNKSSAATASPAGQIGSSARTE